MTQFSQSHTDDRNAGDDTATDPGGEQTRVDQLISLDVHELDAGRGCVVSVAGEVDMLTTPRLQHCLADRVATGQPLLVLDLTKLAFLGSSGLAVLVETLEQARDKQVTLRLVCDSREVTRPLAATGLTELFDTYPTVDAALDGS